MECYGRAYRSIAKFPALLIALISCAWGQETIQVSVDLVNVTFSVRDAAGKPVTGLKQEDFEVWEDGVEQKISFFNRQKDLPLTLGLVVDVSGSQERYNKQHHRDLEEFLKKTLEPRDQAFLVCFGNRLRVASDFSGSAEHLMEALKRFEKGEHALPELGPKEDRDLGTAFYDSIFYSVTEKLAGTERGRRALLMFSDGEDNSSSHNLLDAIEGAQAADVLFFGLRYTELKKGRLSARNKYGISVMDRLASMTGGAHFDARESGLPKAFADIAEQLRTSYEVAYHSSGAGDKTDRNGGFRKIRIKLKGAAASEMTVRAKSGYYAR